MPLATPTLSFDSPSQTKTCLRMFFFIASFLVSTSHETFVKKNRRFWGGAIVESVDYVAEARHFRRSGVRDLMKKAGSEKINAGEKPSWPGVFTEAYRKRPLLLGCASRGSIIRGLLCSVPPRGQLARLTPLFHALIGLPRADFFFR